MLSGWRASEEMHCTIIHILLMYNMLYDIGNKNITFQITLLSRFVGNTLPETIRKIMQRLFTDQFLSKYSFIGFKGKHQFSTLQCCSIIYGNNFLIYHRYIYKM